MPPDAISKAVEKYAEGKGPEWQAKFEQLEQRLIDDHLLKETFARLNQPPGDVKATYSELQSQLAGLANNDAVLRSIGLAASRDRDFLMRDKADAMLSLFDVDRCRNKVRSSSSAWPRLSPDETMQVINRMPPDELQLRVNPLQIVNQ